MTYTPAPTDCYCSVSEGKVLLIPSVVEGSCPYCGMLMDIYGYCKSWSIEEASNTRRSDSIASRIAAIAVLKAAANPNI